MQQYSRETDLQAWTPEQPICLVQFGADTCMPCAAIRQKLEQWAACRPQVRCIYVPTEDFPDVAAAEGVFAVPTILVLVQGKRTLRQSGCFSLQDLFCRVQRYLDLLCEEGPQP